MGVLALILVGLFIIYKYATRDTNYNNLIKNLEEYEKKEAGKQKSKV